MPQHPALASVVTRDHAQAAADYVDKLGCLEIDSTLPEQDRRRVVAFLPAPTEESLGTVAVFQDRYRILRGLGQPNAGGM